MSISGTREVNIEQVGLSPQGSQKNQEPPSRIAKLKRALRQIMPKFLSHRNRSDAQGHGQSSPTANIHYSMPKVPNLISRLRQHKHGTASQKGPGDLKPEQMEHVRQTSQQVVASRSPAALALFFEGKVKRLQTNMPTWIRDLQPGDRDAVNSAWVSFVQAFESAEDVGTIQNRFAELHELTDAIEDFPDLYPNPIQRSVGTQQHRATAIQIPEGDVASYVHLTTVGKKIDFSLVELRGIANNFRERYPVRGKESSDAWTAFDKSVRSCEQPDEVLAKFNELHNKINKYDDNALSGIGPLKDKINALGELLRGSADQRVNGSDWLKKRHLLHQHTSRRRNLEKEWAQAPTHQFPKTVHTAYEKFIKVRYDTSSSPTSKDIAEAADDFFSEMEAAVDQIKVRNWKMIGVTKQHFFKPKDFMALKRAVIDALPASQSHLAVQLALRSTPQLRDMDRENGKAIDKVSVFLKKPISTVDDKLNLKTALNELLVCVEKVDEKLQMQKGSRGRLGKSNIIEKNDFGRLKSSIAKAILDLSQSAQGRNRGPIVFPNAQSIQRSLMSSPPEISRQSTGVSLPSDADYDAVKAVLTNKLRLLRDGWRIFESGLRADNVFAADIWANTDEAFIRVDNLLLHGGSDDAIREALDGFAKIFEQNWHNMETTTPEGNTLHHFARDLIEILDSHKSHFSRWIEEITVPISETFAEAIENNLFRKNPGLGQNKQSAIEQGAGKPSSAAPSVMGWQLPRFAALTIGAVGLLAQNPERGGFDFSDTLADAPAATVGGGTALFNILSNATIGKTLTNSRRLKKDGAALIRDGRKEYENARDISTQPESLLMSTRANTAIDVGHWRMGKGTVSQFNKIHLTSDIIRRWAVATTGTMGVVSIFTGWGAPASLPFLLATGTIGLWSVVDHLIDHRAAAAAEKAGTKNIALLRGDLMRMAEQLNSDQVKLEPAIESLIHKLESDRAFCTAAGVLIPVLAEAFLNSTIIAVLKIASGKSVEAAADGVKDTIKVFAILSNLMIEVSGVGLTAGAIRQIGQRTVMNRGREKARQAYGGFLDRAEHPEQHALYMKQLAKREIGKSITVLKKDAKQMPESQRSRFETFSASVSAIQKNVADQKFSPSRIAGHKKSNWSIDTLRTQAKQLADEINLLRPEVGQSMTADVRRYTNKIEFLTRSDNIHQALDAISSAAAHTGQDTQDTGHSHPITKAVDTAAGLILARAFIELERNVQPSSSSDKSGARDAGDKAAVKHAKALLIEGEVLQAVSLLESIFEKPGPALQSFKGGDLHQLIASMSRHLEFIDSMDHVESRMLEIFDPGQPDDPDSSGLSRVAQRTLENDILLRDPAAMPVVLHWLIRHKDPKMAQYGTNMLRHLGADASSILDLRHIDESKLATAAITQLLQSPPVLGSVPAKDLLEDHWRLAKDDAWDRYAAMNRQDAE